MPDESTPPPGPPRPKSGSPLSEPAAVFIAAAVLTSSADAWNQTMFAAPMIALYLLSIGVAWLVAPKGDKDRAAGSGSTTIRLVVGAMVIDQARRRHGRSPVERGRTGRCSL